MKLDQKILERIGALINEGERVLRTSQNFKMGQPLVDSQSAHTWAVKTLNLLQRVFGENSVHYRKFEGSAKRIDHTANAISALGILKAACDDYEDGYLFETRQLIQAEVFDEFLDQAQHLFEHGYHQSAAVIAGSVLEDGLRKLCDHNNISLSSAPKLDSMNSELARAGVYNKLKQKQITAVADIRNKAAHGEWDEFSPDDVKMMLDMVRNFMTDYF